MSYSFIPGSCFLISNSAMLPAANLKSFLLADKPRLYGRQYVCLLKYAIGYIIINGDGKRWPHKITNNSNRTQWRRRAPAPSLLRPRLLPAPRRSLREARRSTPRCPTPSPLPPAPFRPRRRPHLPTPRPRLLPAPRRSLREARLSTPRCPTLSPLRPAPFLSRRPPFPPAPFLSLREAKPNRTKVR